MYFIKLSDGRVVVTNDLWKDTDSWVSAVPTGALIGQKLVTRICQPKSKEALFTLLGMLVNPGGRSEGWDPIWKTKSGLSDKEAYTLTRKYDGNQLPYTKRRKYRGEGVSASFSEAILTQVFSSPEEAILTHVKIGEGVVEAFNGPEQLHDIDPAQTPVIFLYEKDSSSPSKGLQKGDSIDESYVYDFSDWTRAVLVASYDYVS
jgi:hypothetical protein